LGYLAVQAQKGNQGVIMAWYEANRPRAIVKLASQTIKDKASKVWLFEDPKGTWEAMARRLLEKVPAALESQKLTLSDSKVDEEVAGYLAEAALSARIANIKKKTGPV